MLLSAVVLGSLFAFHPASSLANDAVNSAAGRQRVSVSLLQTSTLLSSRPHELLAEEAAPVAEFGGLLGNSSEKTPVPLVAAQQWTAADEQPKTLPVGDAKPVAPFTLEHSRPTLRVRDNRTTSVVGQLPVHLTFLGSVAVLMLGGLHWYGRWSSSAEAARSVLLLLQCFGLTSFSMVVADSYPLSVGIDVPFAGQSLFTYVCGWVLGQVAGWTVLKRSPDAWRTKPQRPLFVGIWFKLAGALLFMAAASLNEAPRHVPKNMPLVALLAQLLGGLGAGPIMQTAMVSFQHLTPAEERPHQMARFYFASMIGIGLGPVIVAATRELDTATESVPGLWVSGLAQLIFGLLAIAAVALLYPSLRSVPDYLSSPFNSMEGQEDKTVVNLSMLVSMIQSCIVAMFEAGLMLLLEHEYGWGRHSIAAVIGCASLACLPLWFLHWRFQNRATTISWVRCSMGANLLVSTLLFSSHWLDFLNLGLQSQALSVAIVGIATLPILCLIDGLVAGVRNQYVSPPGYLFDVNNTALWAAVSCNTFGQLLGPVFAEIAIQGGGKHAYAWLHLGLGLALAATFELALAPRLVPPSPPVPFSESRPPAAPVHEVSAGVVSKEPKAVARQPGVKAEPKGRRGELEDSDQN
mmetsp:Transcript_5661/g.13242  ORF Transcript_5661/g.13242 Transcript_5661/m.13242 type:complete len:634 (-) Transcript_5661:68-1969(-)